MFFRSDNKEEPKDDEPPKEEVKAEETQPDDAADQSGTDNTGFDDQPGDTSLDEGEYDVESNLDDESEDELEADAEGKGIRVVIKEKNFVELDFAGNMVEKEDEEPTASKGLIKVQNTGSTNRITGIDLELENVDDLQSEEELLASTHIGVLAPGRDNDFKFEYTFQRDQNPIKVEQDYYDPKNGLSPNFLGGSEVDFEAKIIITNTSEESIFDIKGEKTLNELGTLNDSEISEGGEISQEGSSVSFNFEEIEAGASVEVLLKIRASLPDDVPAYEAGNLQVNYLHKDKLTSGLTYKSVDGVSDFRRRVRRRQRETEPSFYDCEIVLENKSEFVYDLNQFSVFAGDLESQQMILDWNGEEATEDEREIVPSEKVAFEFVYESLEGTPSFGDIVEFSVQNNKLISAETEISMPGKELKFMAIAIAKSFLDENDEPINDYEIPSYIETEVPAQVTLTGVGTYPLEGLVIADEIPAGFRVKSTDEVVVMRGGQELSGDSYDVSVGSYTSSKGNSSSDEETDEEETSSDDDHSGDSLIVNLHHLEETDDGGFKEEETITVRYVVIADKLEPQDAPIRVQAHGEGFIYEDETARVYADSDLEGLKLVVVHLRDDVDISKYISAKDHDGKDAYQIELEAENYGSSTVMMEIQDLIPAGFELVEGSITTEPSEDVEYEAPNSVDGGKVHGWDFPNIEPGQNIKATYMLVEIDESANPRQLQSVYKG